MELGRPHTASVGHADDEREAHPPTCPPAVAADMRDELVEARIGERVVLHLDDGAPAGHAEADRGAEDPGLRQRRVDAAIGAEAVVQTCGRAEHAAEAPDVLAEDDHRLVAGELDVQRVVDRLDEEELACCHRRRAHPWTRRSSSRSLASEAGGSA